MVKIQSNIPDGPLAEKWSSYKSKQNLEPDWPVGLQQHPWLKWDLR